MVDSLLQLHQKFIPNLSLHKINNQSVDAFKNWAELWGKSKGLNLEVDTEIKKPSSKNRKRFKVILRSEINSDDSFLMVLKPQQKSTFVSGDLLSIYPEEDHVERLYSIGKIDNNIFLSIKKHEFGICSSYLSKLKENDMIAADIKPNRTFRFPTSTKEVVMIANGTGIAPFLGMINDKNHHQIKTYLFWGGRTKKSFRMYSKLIDRAFYNKKLSGLYLSFSKEESQKRYVQNALIEKEELIARVLKNNGTIMICGSVAMENGVLETLNNISETKLNMPLNMNLIKTDCY